jgi:hypothetical protein
MIRFLTYHREQILTVEIFTEIIRFSSAALLAFEFLLDLRSLLALNRKPRWSPIMLEVVSVTARAAADCMLWLRRGQVITVEASVTYFVWKNYSVNGFFARFKLEFKYKNSKNN